jgi:hypothetical protein
LDLAQGYLAASDHQASLALDLKKYRNKSHGLTGSLLQRYSVRRAAHAEVSGVGRKKNAGTAAGCYIRSGFRFP